jgi:hypothetical protein
MTSLRKILYFYSTVEPISEDHMIIEQQDIWSVRFGRGTAVSEDHITAQQVILHGS